jgi:uncharacterized protein YbaA (DUF1428 family)
VPAEDKVKLLFQTAIVGCLLMSFGAIAIAAQTPDLSQFDLSTKEGVNAAREAISGRKLDDRSRNCVRFDKDLIGIAVVGNFAYDWGCRFSGAFVKTHYLEQDDPGLSQFALAALGWKTANQKQREQLAQVWVAKGMLAFLEVVSETKPDFANHSFQVPQAASQPDGEIVVTLWIHMPVGRSRGRTYQLREFRFSADGALSSAVTRDSFSTSNND